MWARAIARPGAKLPISSSPARSRRRRRPGFGRRATSSSRCPAVWPSGTAFTAARTWFSAHAHDTQQRLLPVDLRCTDSGCERQREHDGSRRPSSRVDVERSAAPASESPICTVSARNSAVSRRARNQCLPAPAASRARARSCAKHRRFQARHARIRARPRSTARALAASCTTPPRPPLPAPANSCTRRSAASGSPAAAGARAHASVSWS